MPTPRLPIVDSTDAPANLNGNRPFRRKTKSGFFACDVTFQPASTDRAGFALVAHDYNLKSRDLKYLLPYRPSYQHWHVLVPWNRTGQHILGAFAKLRWLLTSLWLSICRHGTSRLPLEVFSCNLIFTWFFSPKMYRESSILIKTREEWRVISLNTFVYLWQFLPEFLFF